jgi:hypothetical protein
VPCRIEKDWSTGGLAAWLLLTDSGSAYALAMSSDFAQLITDIEREAHEEGPRAVRELKKFREEFGFAGVRIATSLLKASNDALGRVDS